MEFTEFKNEIIERAKKADACSKGIRHAKQAIDYKELFDVISENFLFCCDNKIIDVALLKNVEDLALYNFYINETCESGFLLADSATVRASGSATVRAWGSATVEAWGSATVEASGSATVRAWDSATVEASGSATVRAWDSATVEAWGSAYIDSRNTIEHKISEKVILRYYFENKVILAPEINK